LNQKRTKMNEEQKYDGQEIVEKIKNAKLSKPVQITLFAIILILLIGLLIYAKNIAKPCDVCKIDLPEFDFGPVSCRDFVNKIHLEYTCFKSSNPVEQPQPIIPTFIG